MEALRRAVIEAPDDDAPRLVYADALMRRGDPRGEFIALQLAGRPEAAALLAAHRAEWLAAMPHVIDAHFERGFATDVALRCDARDAAAALACCDVEPIHSVTLICDSVDDPDTIDHVAVARWFAADPRTARLRMLDLTRPAGSGWKQPALSILLSADLPNLRELHIADGDCRAHAIPDIVARANLTTLRFWGDWDASLADGIPLLVSSPNIASLEELVVDDCGLGPAAGTAIAASPYLARLRFLSFSGGGYCANTLGDEGALALAHSTMLTALDELALGHNGVTDAFLEALASPAALPALTSLAVNGCTRITSRGLATLAAAPRFATMRALWLGGCRIDDEGVAALARSPYAGALRAINLHGNPLTAEAARALASSPLASRLDHLSIALTPEIEAILRPAFGDRLR